MTQVARWPSRYTLQNRTVHCRVRARLGGRGGDSQLNGVDCIVAGVFKDCSVCFYTQIPLVLSIREVDVPVSSAEMDLH